MMAFTVPGKKPNLESLAYRLRNLGLVDTSKTHAETQSYLERLWRKREYYVSDRAEYYYLSGRKVS